MIKKELENIENADEQEDRSIWSKAFVFLFICSILMHTGQEMTGVLIGKFVDSFGVPASMVGAITGSYAFTALFCRLFSGAVVDALDRKKVLVAGIGILAASCFAYAIATSIPMVIFARLLSGVSMAFNSACALTMASNTLPRKKFGSGIFIFSLSTAMAQTVAPSIGVAIADAFGFSINFFTSGCVCVIAMLFACTLKGTKRPAKKIVIKPSNIVARECIVPAIIMFLLKVSFFCGPTFLLIYAEQIGVTEGIGFYFTVYACTMFISRPLAGKISDRHGMTSVLIPSIVIFAISFLIISVSSTLWHFLLAAFVGGFGFATSHPALQTIAMEAVPPERRGVATSTCYIAQDSGNLVGPIVGGLVAEAWGYTLMWRVMIIPIAVSLIIACAYYARLRKIEKNFAHDA